MTMGLLGKVDGEYVDGIERGDVDFSKSLYSAIVESVPQVGFWLPQSGDRAVGGVIRLHGYE